MEDRVEAGRAWMRGELSSRVYFRAVRREAATARRVRRVLARILYRLGPGD